MATDKPPTTKEWRKKILAGDTDALHDLQHEWLDLFYEGQRIVEANEDHQLCERPGLYHLTYLLASVCDLGPASIDPTPLIDCYQLMADFRGRQSGKQGTLPANATEDELRQFESRLNRAYAVLNRMTYAWVAGEDRTEEPIPPNDHDPPQPDGPVDGFRWRHNGELIKDTMAPKAWRLANHLFHTNNRTAPYQDLAPIVADDHAETLLDFSNCRGHRDRANTFFKKNEIPLTISLRGQPTLDDI